MKRLILWVTMGVFSLGMSVAGPADAAMVTHLDLTGGAINYDGEHSEMVDHLLGQKGTLKLGQFQAIDELVPSIDKACETYSLFTSSFTGESAPSATISGASISLDLSSLFFAVSRDDFHKTWNVGDLATGQYNPETREFTVSWNHLFDNGTHEGLATFFLKGVAGSGIGADPQPVAIPAAMVLYATGVFGLGFLTYRRRGLTPTLSA